MHLHLPRPVSVQRLALLLMQRQVTGKFGLISAFTYVMLKAIREKMAK